MKINFVLNSVLDAHSLKRVNDFKEFGFDVKVYGFVREQEANIHTDATVIGKFSNALSYRKRIKIYFHGINNLFKREKDENVIWYYLGLDVAMFAVLLRRKQKFIYEECDLVQTYIANKSLSRALESMDKLIIRKSLLTLMTSSGFLQYHYKDYHPHNIMIVPNKLSPKIKEYPAPRLHSPDSHHLRFAFVGGVRYASLLSIAQLITSNFPNHEFHFYGFISPTLQTVNLPKADNIFYHGRFNSPEDLNGIYSNIDILVCTYDTDEENVKYAEPNKLYEALYFNCPIIVSKGTFLSKRVQELNIGYDVDAYQEEDVKTMVKHIEKDVYNKVNYISSMDKSSSIDDDSYLRKIDNYIK